MSLSLNGFQNVINAKAPPAIAGDFASVNPRASVLATEGNLVAGVGGLAVGNFAFVNPADQSVHQNYVNGYQIGFLSRVQQGLITQFLGLATMAVPRGFMVTLHDQGEFFAAFAGGATAGQTVYADETTGAAISGSATDTVTASAGYTGTASFATSVMTVVTATAGVVSVGDTVTSAGVAAGTTVTSFGTGTGGVGTYNLSTAPGTIATQAATTSSVNLRVTAVLTGALSVGDVLSGSGVTAGTTITSVPPAGGAGIYGLSVAQNFASTTVTVVNGNIVTGYKVVSNALAGELAIISSWA